MRKSVPQVTNSSGILESLINDEEIEDSEDSEKSEDSEDSDADALDHDLDDAKAKVPLLGRSTSYSPTALSDTGNEIADIRFVGVQPLNDVASEKIKPLVIQQLQGMFLSQRVSVARSLAWLVAIPEGLEIVTSVPDVKEEKMIFVLITMVAWIAFIISSVVLMVTAFMQAPRPISYVSGAFLGFTCLAFSVVVFAKGKPELAGAICPPNLPPAGLRMALNLQQWMQMVSTSKQDIQDMMN